MTVVYYQGPMSSKWYKNDVNLKTMNEWLIFASPEWRCLMWDRLVCSCEQTCVRSSPLPVQPAENSTLATSLHVGIGWSWYVWHSIVTEPYLRSHLCLSFFTLVSCNCPSNIENWNHKWFQMCVCRSNRTVYTNEQSSGILSGLKMAQRSASRLNKVILDWPMKDWLV